jgi:16S rRNA (guanine527-N7)-methyltransferase
MTAQEQLQQGLAALRLEIPPPRILMLLRYCELLEKWNRVYNLTAIRERAKLVSHHLLDCLAVVSHVSADSLVDVGSGAGLPGIPLAVANPNTEVVLLESSHKKGAFLRQAIMELQLGNAQVVISRAEDYHPAVPFSMAVSRAFSDLAGFVEAARHLVRSGGLLGAMKGIYPHEEIAQLPPDVALESVVELSVPGLRAARHLVVMKMNPGTPK